MKKKIIIAVLAILLAAGITGVFWGPSIVEAATGVWESCPFGEVNDTYPGDCHNYIDTNRDNICDRSQPAPQSNPTPTPTTSAVSLPAASPTAIAASGNNDTAESAVTDSAAATGNSHSYNFIPIIAVVVVLYCLTWVLSARKIIKNMLHRKIWNVVLLVTMAVSASLGIVRVLSIDFNIDISLPFNTLFWHVEASIVLGTVVLFHIIWHWRYYTKMLGIAGNRGA